MARRQTYNSPMGMVAYSDEQLMRISRLTVHSCMWLSVLLNEKTVSNRWLVDLTRLIGQHPSFSSLEHLNIMLLFQFLYHMSVWRRPFRSGSSRDPRPPSLTERGREGGRLAGQVAWLGSQLDRRTTIPLSPPLPPPSLRRRPLHSTPHDTCANPACKDNPTR